MKIVSGKQVCLFGKELFTCIAPTCRWNAYFLWDEGCENYYTEPAMYGWSKPKVETKDVQLRLLKRINIYSNADQPVVKGVKEKVITVRMNENYDTDDFSSYKRKAVSDHEETNIKRVKIRPRNPNESNGIINSSVNNNNNRGDNGIASLLIAARILK